ncbi:uncharacterized protein [Mytilus edulis]|uniref:uncharacterized protein n=1 Tax=Mytilus edulis TaxID=6550 RepID=UPI0039EE8AF3
MDLTESDTKATKDEESANIIDTNVIEESANIIDTNVIEESANIKDTNETEETTSTTTCSLESEHVDGARARTLSEKGQQYEFDKLAHSYGGLNRLSENIIDLIADKAPYDTIKGKYSIWMDKYEMFLEQHQNIMPKIGHEEDKESYMMVFQEKDESLREIKRSIENYFNAIREENKQTQRSKSVISKRSSLSRSSLSSQRLKEEQKRVELETKLAALKRKKDIELAKLKLKLEEEELQLDTDIAIADAKTKLLDKYENLESESNSTCSTHFSKVQSKPKKSDIALKTAVNYNVMAKPFVPKNEIKEVLDTRPVKALQVNKIISTSNNTHLQEPKNEHNTTVISSIKHDENMNNIQANTVENSNIAENSKSAVVKHLRKPTPDIKKFGGNPLEYRKFYRQFQARIVANTDNEEEKMTYLEQFTYGEASKVVSGFSHLIGEHAYSAAIKQLEERYGDTEVIANAFIKRALEWPTIQAGDSKSLDDFSLFLIECENAAVSMEAMRILEYSENIKRLMIKLPFYFHDRWRNVVMRTKEKKDLVTFTHFVQFVKQEAKKANDPTYGNIAVSAKQNNTRDQIARNVTDNKSKQTQRMSFATDVKNEHDKHVNELKCTYCGNCHKLEDCKSILSLSIRNRYEHLKSKGHCFGCLKIGHRTVNCKMRATCLICNKRHPTLLHDKEKIPRDVTPMKQSESSTEVENKTSACTSYLSDNNSQVGAGDMSCAMAIIPVRVKLKNKAPCVETYAFFDSGSSVSFCTENLLHKLGGNGKRMQITLNTMGEPYKMTTYAVSGLQVLDLEMNDVVELPRVYTKDEMPVSVDHIPKQEEISKWSHLSGIKWPNLDASIGLMIGNNVPDAYTPFEVATGPSGSPHGLGWIIWNMIRECTGTNKVVNRVEMSAIHEEEHSRLNKLVEKSMNFDFPERIIDDKRENSVDDNSFLDYVNKNIHFEKGQYYIPLPFRDSNVKLPNNASQGQQRLRSLKNKFIKNPKFKQDYTDFMDKLLERGYMEHVPKEQFSRNDGRVCYIPHHGVYHSQKPDKIRIVFDCSATYMGVSLNKQLLQGPDLTNNLLGVLIRFREEKVAILGDIEAMFHQVKVPPLDRDCLRFFWWPNGNVENEPEQYRMTVHLFGATSSPSCCNYALKRTAEDFGEHYDKEVAHTITKSMYVDDCLSSLSTDVEAISLIKDVTSLCEKGGFHMTKWISNSPYVIKSIPEEERAKEVKQWSLEVDLPVERALGVQWFIETDTLGFRIKCKEKIATRRNASEIGYGMVFYLRLVDDEGMVHCSFVLGKSRVAPLKKVTIPRMELTAATRAVKLSKVILEELNYSIDKTFFWTDSMSVLRYINNQNIRFHTFVANRLEVIHEATIVDQLKYINTKLNPADYASRGMSVSKFESNPDWFNGPEYLWKPEIEWPEGHIDKTIIDEDKEVKRVVNTTILSSKHYELDRLFSLFSEWKKLKKITSWLFIALDNLRKLVKERKQIRNRRQSENENSVDNQNERTVRKSLNGVTKDVQITLPTTETLNRSEMAIIKYEQNVHFEEEIHVLQNIDRGKVLKKSSKLFKLNPFIDENGLLRVGGRLERADLPYDAKHPILLPKDSNISKLIIEDIHRSVGHLGKNSILAQLRQKFWIIGAGSMIKGIVSKCVICRKYCAPFVDQKMANLPKERLISDKPPFTMVGMDFFGPFQIKQGRSLVKRYGVIFTCLSIRAVHLEIAHSMDTDSCINAIRRLISRRGNPEFIRSDNGTNLVGAEREMREEIERWNKDKINNFMLQKSIKWAFNPPAASHFGGVWERLIRSVRKVLYSVMQMQSLRLNDENLNTLFCEVEAILNNRPISEVSENVDDLKVLTPNHLLLLRPGEYFPPGTFL